MAGYRPQVGGLSPAGMLVSRPAGILTISIADAVGMLGTVAVSPDGSQVSGIWETDIHNLSNPHAYFDGIWRVSDGQQTLSRAAGTGYTDLVPSTFFSPDGTLVVFGSGGALGTCVILNASDGSLHTTLGTANVPLAFSADGSAILATPQGSPLGQGFEVVRVADGVTALTISMPLNAAGDRLLAAGFGSSLTALAIVDPQAPAVELFTEGTQTGSVQRVGWQNTAAGAPVAISPDGSRVVAGNFLWSTGNSSGGSTGTSSGPTTLGQPLSAFPQSVAFSPDGAMLAICGSSAVSIMGGSSSLPVAAYAVAFSPDSKLIATGDADYTAKVWNVAGSLAQTLWSLSAGHTSAVDAIAFSPDGSTVVTGSLDGTIKLWNVASGALISTISAGLSYVTALSFSSDGTQIVGSYSPNRSGITVWDVASGEVVNSLAASEPVLTASTLFALDGGGIGRYSWPSLAPLGDVPLSNMVSAEGLAVTPSGSMLASIDGGGVIHLWCSP